ncbi:MAG: DUF1553 domain-containing protein [Pirellulales bacterium]|nr:DUF1553 domain-containing protein [Pirellulales bacterium]
MPVRELVCVGAIVMLGWCLCGPASVCADEVPAKFFDEQVKPILVNRCLSCHGADKKGGLDLRTKAALLQGGESGAVIEPGSPQESLLVDYVQSEEMPPKKPLSDAEVAILTRWVARGGYFPDEPLDIFALTTETRAGYDWWSLRPLSTVLPPSPDEIGASWSQHPIDCFVRAALHTKGLSPSPKADKRTLIRRATYDLTGLPPTPQEVAAFEKDQREDAYDRLIDRLLASPHYGEHWGRHWLDVVRFGESRGYERNEVIDNAWPFRDYVIRSLNDDKPFDQLVREQLAGDVIGPGEIDVEVGTAFLVCGPFDDVGNQNPEQAAQSRANTIDDVIRATSEAFLGLTVGCSRCHDHKFDPIRQTDYYSLYATFAGIQHADRELGTEEQKEQRAGQLAPLTKRKEELQKEFAKFEGELTAAAIKRADEFVGDWLRPPASRRGTEEVFPPVLARHVRLTVDGTDVNPAANIRYRIDEFEVWTSERGTSEGPSRNVALADNGGQAIGKNFVAEDFVGAYVAELTIDGKFEPPWIAAGPELVVTLAENETIDRVFFSSDRSGAAGDQFIATFVGEYQIDVSLNGEDWQAVASSATRQPVTEAHRNKRIVEHLITDQQRQRRADLTTQLAEVDRKIAEIAPLPTWWVGTFKEASGPFHVFVGGSPQKTGEVVVPASPSVLKQATTGYHLAADAPESERRRQLAEWITAPDNPLTPRVLANRLWHYHFGTGIVDTPSDFGFMGGRPTHPGLLDWLAAQVQSADWKLKQIHKLIMTSQTYQQQSAFEEIAAGIDADSRYLWRFPPRRLSAEEIRDTLLAIAGKIDFTAGGPGFRLFRYMQDNVSTYLPLDQFGPETYRRSVYHQNARATVIDIMTDFDAPDCAFATPRRTETTTPLQALTMMNHSFIIDMARFLAERIEAEGPPEQGGGESAPAKTAAQVRRAFELALARGPDQRELNAAALLVEKHGLAALCRAMFNTNELIYLD